jgi:hypothetical protein
MANTALITGSYQKMPVRKISSPIPINISPPKILAFPASISPNFLPIFTPAVQMKERNQSDQQGSQKRFCDGIGSDGKAD